MITLCHLSAASRDATFVLSETLPEKLMSIWKPAASLTMCVTAVFWTTLPLEAAVMSRAKVYGLADLATDAGSARVATLMTLDDSPASKWAVLVSGWKSRDATAPMPRVEYWTSRVCPGATGRSRRIQKSASLVRDTCFGAVTEINGSPSPAMSCRDSSLSIPGTADVVRFCRPFGVCFWNMGITYRYRG